MRKIPGLAVGALLLGVIVVSLASASSNASTASWLAPGVTPAGANWVNGEGDISNSRYSPLNQITSNNVQNLHVVWNQQFNTPDIQFSPEGQPICCVNNLLYQAYIQGVAAMAPDTGAIAWNYAGPASPQLTQLGQRLRVDNTRTTSYSAKLNLIYAGQQDGSIVALNAKSGAPVWTTSVIGAGTYGDVTGAESAPFTQVYDVPGTNGIVLSAPNGGESPFRGHLDAFDAKTGKLLWRSWNLPDPTQVPYILSWGNPAEAATGGAADWSIPAIDPQLGTVYYGTGNPFPETGRAPGADLWTESIMAVDWKTGALKWFFQTTHHDWLDFDDPHPPMVLRVPIDGKVTPVLAEGSKGGFFYALNAVNGSKLPHFKITETPVPDPTGNGLALNGFYKSQPYPSGASFCAVIVDYSPAGLAQCNFPGNPLADEYGPLGIPGNTVSGPNQVTNLSNGWPINGSSESAAHGYGQYLVYGGAGGGGNFGYPPSAYSPQTHTYYACLQNQSGAHANQGPNTYAVTTIGQPLNNGTVGFMSAIDMTNNTMKWQYASQASGLGVCYSGSLATGGNLVFTWFKGRSDQAAALALLPNQGTTQQGAGTLLTPGAQLDAFDATTGKIVWVWGIPNDTGISPTVTYSYKGKQYLATYHGVATAGTPGATPTGQRDQLTVFSL
jgi:quinohemoprotein ethanol dehydrogenase